MSNMLAESLLEMAYFHALSGLLLNWFRAQGRGVLIWKPSTTVEARVGFDQGWIVSASTSVDDEMRSTIASAAGGGPPVLPKSIFYAYFLQFKVANEMKYFRRSWKRDHGFASPWYRASLSLEPNKTTRRSQHETLVALSKLPNANVCYAVPIITTPEELMSMGDFSHPCGWCIDETVALSRLRIVDVKGSPVYANGENHYLAFRSALDEVAFWLSKPAPAVARGPEAWLERLQRSELNFESVLALVESSQAVLREYPTLAGGLRIVELVSRSAKGPRL